MKRGLAKSLTIIVLLLIAAWIVNFEPTKASDTLIVPTQYPTITSAISHASAGDIIQIEGGTYQENVVVDKPLTLMGQNSPVILGTGGPTPAAALVLAANGIVVSGLTIESAQSANATQYAYGIWVNGDNCTISGNTIQNTYIGIFSSVQSKTTITHNTIQGSMKDGIRFVGGSQTTVSDNNVIDNAVSGIAINGYSNIVEANTILGNTRGVGLGASYSVLFGNNITGNSESGVFLAGSQNIITANDISNNKYGVFVTVQLTAPLDNQLYHNNLVDNTYSAYDNSTGLIESWDNGAQSGGNYWSDYQTKYPDATQVGSTGIWSTPYAINQNNQDNYPLTAPFNTQNPGNTPSAIAAPAAKPDSVVASWSFNTVEGSLITPDSTGNNNPAVLGSETPAYNYTPAQVSGKFGEALNFTGNVYAAVHPALSLETPNEVTIDAWVYMQTVKDVAYDNIFIEAVRTTAPLPTRTLGLAVNGEIPTNTSSPPIGALRGYVTTAGGLNEIDTVAPIPFNTWVHVVFVRSQTTGMHIYVDGEEQNVMVSSGSANPSGPTLRATDIYIGHDATITIDELKISNTAQVVGQTGQPFWMQWWLWAVVVAAFLGAFFSLIFYLRTRIEPKNRLPTFAI